VEPNIGLVEPNIGLVEPNIGLVEPNIGLVEPNIGLVEPNIGLAEHNIGLVEPNIGLVEPNIGLVEPNIGLAEPNIGLVEPNIGLVEPNIGLVKPNIGLVESIQGLVESIDLPVLAVPVPSVAVVELEIPHSRLRSCRFSENDPLHRGATRLGSDRILSRFGENDLVQCQRVGDHGVVDTAHGVAFVIEDVVAHGELAFQQVEVNLTRHPPEVALGDIRIDEPHDLTGNSETHGAPPSHDDRTPPSRRRQPMAQVPVIRVTRQVPEPETRGQKPETRNTCSVPPLPYRRSS
jgi:hypothetical protein